MQPVVRALPVQLGAARPARADHGASARRSSTSCSGCRSSTSTSAAASRPSGRTSGRSLDYATAHDVGVKFSTNGVKITPDRARQLAASDYVDVQISLDGATAEVNDAVRGPGSYDTALRAMRQPGRRRVRRLQDLGRDDPAQRRPARRSSRRSPTGSARSCGSPGCARPAGARTSGTSCTRPRPSSASCTTGWSPTASQRAHRRLVLPPGRVRRGAARAQPVRRGPGGVPDRPGRRRVRLPVRHPRQLPGRQRPRPGRVRAACGSTPSCSPGCASRRPAGPASPARRIDACRGGCMAAKFFTGLPLDGPDPECVKGHGERALATGTVPPRPSGDHSHRTSARRPVPLTLGRRPPVTACDSNPLAGFTAGTLRPACGWLTSPHPMPAGRPRPVRCSRCRSAPPSSTARTCRCPPTATSRWRCATGSRPPAATC